MRGGFCSEGLAGGISWRLMSWAAGEVFLGRLFDVLLFFLKSLPGSSIKVTKGVKFCEKLVG